jgi:hypothetical protein
VFIVVKYGHLSLFPLSFFFLFSPPFARLAAARLHVWPLTRLAISLYLPDSMKNLPPGHTIFHPRRVGQALRPSMFNARPCLVSARLILPSLLLCQETISPRLDCNTVHRTLGVMINPAGDNKKSIFKAHFLSLPSEEGE